MGKAKKSKSKKSKGGIVSKAVSAGKSALGMGAKEGKRRSKGPAYYAKKIAVMKLKKKLAKLRGY